MFGDDWGTEIIPSGCGIHHQRCAGGRTCERVSYNPHTVCQNTLKVRLVVGLLWTMKNHLKANTPIQLQWDYLAAITSIFLQKGKMSLKYAAGTPMNAQQSNDSNSRFTERGTLSQRLTLHTAYCAHEPWCNHVIMVNVVQMNFNFLSLSPYREEKKNPHHINCP